MYLMGLLVAPLGGGCLASLGWGAASLASSFRSQRDARSKEGWRRCRSHPLCTLLLCCCGGAAQLVVL